MTKGTTPAEWPSHSDQRDVVIVTTLQTPVTFVGGEANGMIAFITSALHTARLVMEGSIRLNPLTLMDLILKPLSRSHISTDLPGKATPSIFFARLPDDFIL